VKPERKKKSAGEGKEKSVGRKKRGSKEVGSEISMYTLKFNQPILPFAKFPLTQNRYIQEFMKRYQED